MLINNRWILIFLFSCIFLLGSQKETKDFITLWQFDATENISAKKIIQDQYMNLVSIEDFIERNLTSPNPIENLYDEPATRWLVEDFLIRKIGSKEIVDTVLLYTVKKNLSIKLVFSLVFVESSYSMQAVNYNSSSKDLGLFQLNSTTFRHLSNQEFFHLETNVNMGTSYLAYAFSLDPDPRIALAIYNAGPKRPLNGLTPDSTKLYVKKILTQANDLERSFISYVWTKLDHAKKESLNKYTGSDT